MITRSFLLCVALALWSGASSGVVESSRSPAEVSFARRACFLLYEIGKGEVRREPGSGCNMRITPGSTFKIPQALFALDAGVVSGPDELIAYDGTGNWPESSRRDHTLASAMHESVIWYTQKLAERLGAEREQSYLVNIGYGNMDASGPLTRFWMGDSLAISPEEQQTFLLRLYNDKLPLSHHAAELVRGMLVQPRDVIINSQGKHKFDAPWPPDAVVSAKTASMSDLTGQAVRWLVGHVKRGDRAYVFVSCVVGSPVTTSQNAAIDQAAKGLREAGVL